MTLLVALWFAALAAATVAVGRSLAPRPVRLLDLQASLSR